VQLTLGWCVLILGCFLYFAQLISSINFRLAQRLGIQEDPEVADRLLQRSERYTAYWDLITLAWLPLAGFLMIINHAWWPVLLLIGGAIYLDASGREAAKILSFRHQGINTGSKKQQKIFFVSYIVMAAVALVSIAYAIDSMSSFR
jgi:hypothetical protein